MPKAHLLALLASQPTYWIQDRESRETIESTKKRVRASEETRVNREYYVLDIGAISSFELQKEVGVVG